jgi:streptogramin lyase
VGPDGNLWFPEYAQLDIETFGSIGRITPSGAVTEFPLHTPGDHPGSLTVGPDGNLWFPDGGGSIGRITPLGAVTLFPLPTTSSYPGALTVGPDGNLWFPAGPHIDRITPSGAVTEFPLHTTSGDPGALTVGPDGNLWFPLADHGGIGRITPSGTITEFPLPSADFQPSPDGLMVGPDGNLWFGAASVSGSAVIGRITPSGAVTEFPLHSTGGDPGALTVGPDGNLWFHEVYHGGRIGRITPSGTITEFPLHTTGLQAVDLTVGPDGNLWFSEGPENGFYPGGTSGIGRITPSGAVTEFHLHKVSYYPFAPPPGDLTVGPDGNLWFPDEDTVSIGRINPTPPRVTEVVPVAHSRAGTTEIVLSFNQALDPRTAGKLGFYHLAAGMKTRHTLVFSQGLKIASVLYDGSTHQVTLKLAKPRKGAFQLTVRPGIVAADGISSFNAFTAVIS